MITNLSKEAELMKRMKLDIGRLLINTSMIVVCLMLVGGIYWAMNRGSEATDLVVTNEENNVIVETKTDDQVEENSPVVILDSSETSEAVSVDQIVEDKLIVNTTGISTTETINALMPEEPEKPALTPPTQKPKTTDDLTDVSKTPTYPEKETVIIPEVKKETMKVDTTEGTPTTSTGESKLVPDAENPFLQEGISENGSGGAVDGSTLYQDGVAAGSGDKF